MKNPKRTARRTLAAVLAGTVVSGTAAVTLAPGAEAAPRGADAFGLTANGRLVQLDNLRRPGNADVVGKVTGLGGERLVGIDVRPATGRLYGLGDDGGLFIVNPRNARARQVGELSVGLDGAFFGVDVNPAADALRIVSNTGQNLRYSFEAGTTTVDGPLNVPDTTPRVRGIVGAAYTNNDNDDSTGTALFDLNAASDSIVLQIPANAGTITSQGPLGKRTSLNAGFDIYTNLQGGQAVANAAYATLGRNGGYTLFRVDTLSGKARKVGDFRQAVVDIAVVHN